MRRESLRFDSLVPERIICDGIKSVWVDLIRKPSFLQSQELVCPQHKVCVGRRIHCGPHAWVMREGVAIQPKHGLASFALDLETLSLDVAHFQVDLPVLKAQRGNVAIAIEGHVARMRRHEWINGHPIERAVDLRRNVTEDNEVCHLALNATGQIGTVEVFGIGPF